MAYNYDALYAAEPRALGDQTKDIVTFLNGLALSDARILDVGCGRGRDALPLARAGHDVTGVDLSPSGVNAKGTEAEREVLSLTGHVADVTDYGPNGAFDVLLIDHTLHMLDAAPRATHRATASDNSNPVATAVAMATRTPVRPQSKTSVNSQMNRAMAMIWR
ncbi:MAG: class I SAM-dependent methyltransferase [Octadecabacter sp.]